MHWCQLIDIGHDTFWQCIFLLKTSVSHSQDAMIPVCWVRLYLYGTELLKYCGHHCLSYLMSWPVWTSEISSNLIMFRYMTTSRNGGCWCQAEEACWSRRCHGWTRGHSCRSVEWKNNAFGFTLLSFVFRIYVCISTYLKLVRWTFQSRFGTCFAPHFCQTFSMLLLD